jgi:hypothetical protein
MHSILRGALAVAALAAGTLVGCAKPETECRDGVDQMRKQLDELIGSGSHQDVNDPVVQAHNQFNMAYTEMTAGNYPGCVDFLKEARITLKNSVKTNKE